MLRYKNQNMKRAHIFIEGRVQGVSYRWWTKKTANDLGLTGWVRNLEDGRVEVIAEGKEDQVNQLIELIKKGPRFSKVHKVDVKFGDASGEFEGLEIRY